MQLTRLPAAFRGVSRIAAGSIAGQGLVMLSYPLLTRLFDAGEFGLLTVFTSVVTIISVGATATLERAIPIPQGDPEAADVAWTALAAVALTSVLTAVVGLVAAAPIAELLGVPQLAQYWWLIVFTVFAVGAYLVLSEWMVRTRSYGALGRRNLLQGVGQTATQVTLGLMQIRPVGLLLGLGIGRLCGLGGLLSSGGLLRQPRPTMAGLRRTLRRYRRFPMLTLPSALVNSAGLEAPLLVIAAYYGDARAGLLGLTIRVFSAPTAIIGQAIDQVFTGESSAAIREPTGTLTRLLRHTAARLLIIGVLPTAILVVAGPWLFGLVFGPTWTEAGDYARILAFAYLAQFVVNPISGVLQLLERQGQSLAWAAMRLVLTVSGPAVCGVMGAPVVVAIAALSIGHVLSYLLMYVLSLRAARAADDHYLRARE
jgi:O-antigen/teichoic acid export membrane protein